MSKILAAVLMLCSLACSAPMGEYVGEVQEAVGTCPRPVGGTGDKAAPLTEFITRINPGLVPWELALASKDSVTGATSNAVVNFGGVSVTQSHANIIGPGWYAQPGGKVVRIQYVTMGTRRWWRVYERVNGVNLPHVDAVGFLISYSTPTGLGYTFGDGLTRIEGMGETTPQVMQFWYDGGASIGTHSTYYTGSELDHCHFP